MIYAGFINFKGTPNWCQELKSVLFPLTQTSPSIVNRKGFTLCYGKLSNEQDFDDIWENESSIVLGRIFDRELHCSFPKGNFKNFSHLDKEVILENLWGKYVYINSNKVVSQFEVVLDSTGQLPFFYYPFANGNVLFSSHIEIIYKILSQKADYNWKYLCSYLIYGNSSAIETPFNNIYELPLGCSLRVTKNEIKTTLFWNPLHSYYVEAPQEKDAMEALNTSLIPWINPYKNVFLSLSGGLDSSSLAYCLKKLVTEDQCLKAINYFHSQIQSSNELSHARKVCQETGIELVEVDAADSLPFTPPQRKQPLKPNKPFPGLISLRWMERLSDYLPFDEAFTFVSGHGSDHIFMRPPPKRSVSDYVIEKGLKGFKREIERFANFYRAPDSSILKENVKALLHYYKGNKKEKMRSKSNIREVPQWVKREAIRNSSTTFAHPLYEYLPNRILPGKYDQIGTLYEGLASIHVEILNQIDPTYYPFLYKPVVDFALSLPTYDLIQKGYDRYPLRKAVSEHFKTGTVWRRDKGQTTGLFQLGIKDNFGQVLETCLEGHFVKQGYLDRDGLHNTIIFIGNGDIKNLWPLLRVASAEIFLRSWDEGIQ